MDRLGRSRGVGIGLLLIVVAFLLTRRSKTVLLDESTPPGVLEPTRARDAGAGWVDEVREPHAVYARAREPAGECVCDPRRGGKSAASLVGRVAELLTHPAIAQVRVKVAVDGDLPAGRLPPSTSVTTADHGARIGRVRAPASVRPHTGRSVISAPRVTLVEAYDGPDSTM